ncbi:MAG: hypothetical protein GY810_01540 [Aureispira sp.]|nr:hypothetical protein [Aureispira sp.]
MKSYKVILHPETLAKTRTYQKALVEGQKKAGSFLLKKLYGKNISKLSIEEFIEAIVQTKQPQIFAESAVYGDGKDWNLEELSILGDISIAVPLTVFDNGAHSYPLVHKTPFEGMLMYTPGALLRNGKNYTPADWNEVVKGQNIDDEGYYNLYKRRLLPVFLYVNTLSQNQKAVLTIPGLGCGMFAGQFKGQLGAKLDQVLSRFLQECGALLPNIKAVYYDPYQECQNRREEWHGISYLVRPLTHNNQGKSQLSRVEILEDAQDDFSDCKLYSIVAWDHVSWPGNDFYVGSRATDDGVKAAATSSMWSMTGVEGAYSTFKNKYNPPKGYNNWDAVVSKNNIEIEVVNNLLVLPKKD